MEYRCPHRRADGTECTYAGSLVGFRRHLVKHHQMQLHIRRINEENVLRYVLLSPEEARYRHRLLSCRQAGRGEVRAARRREAGDDHDTLPAPSSSLGGRHEPPPNDRFHRGGPPHEPPRFDGDQPQRHLAGGRAREPPAGPTAGPTAGSAAASTTDCRSPHRDLEHQDSDDDTPLAFRIRNVRRQGTARPADVNVDDVMDDWMLDNVDFPELTQLPASPPPPVFYRTMAETTDSGTDPIPAPPPPPTLAVLPLSQERIADLVSTELSARLNLRVDQVADRVVERVRDLTLVDAAQEQTLRVAVNFAAHVLAGAADSVLGSVSALSANAVAPSSEAVLRSTIEQLICHSYRPGLHRPERDT